MLTRRGATLIELLVAITMAAIVLGAASTTLVHQRRESDRAASRSSAESQLRAALAEVPSALAGSSPAEGDLVAGEARDTALQIRAAVVQGVACDGTTGQLILSASDTGPDRETAVLTAPRAGDTLWWWPPGAASWSARRVSSVTSASAPCARQGAATRPLLILLLSASDTVPRDAPIRVTREVRYSFYRAGDGSWQLGIADWSEVLHDFASPQPVAGPFLLAAQGGRTGFRYFDASGAELSVTGQGAPVGSVARLRMIVSTSAAARGASPFVMHDSMDVALAHAP